MINLEHTTEPQRIAIPRAANPADGQMRLVIRNGMTRKETILEMTGIVLTPLVIYATITLPKTDRGQYEYRLTEGGRQISSGLLIIGGRGIDRTEFNETINTIQYEG